MSFGVGLRRGRCGMTGTAASRRSIRCGWQGPSYTGLCGGFAAVGNWRMPRGSGWISAGFWKGARLITLAVASPPSSIAASTPDFSYCDFRTIRACCVSSCVSACLNLQWTFPILLSLVGYSEIAGTGVICRCYSPPQCAGWL